MSMRRGGMRFTGREHHVLDSCLPFFLMIALDWHASTLARRVSAINRGIQQSVDFDQPAPPYSLVLDSRHMSWHCPACRSAIPFDPIGTIPDPNEAYRCHVCRLDLRFDPAEDMMVIAPFEADRYVPPLKAQSKSIRLPTIRRVKSPRKPKWP
jgi:hypothetical protein